MLDPEVFSLGNYRIFFVHQDRRVLPLTEKMLQKKENARISQDKIIHLKSNSFVGITRQ